MYSQKRKLCIILTLGFASACASGDVAQSFTGKPHTDRSYLYGLDEGARFGSQGLQISVENYSIGFMDRVEQRPSQVSEAEADVIRSAHEQALKQRLSNFFSQVSTEGARYTRDFLSDPNASKTTDGLLYKILEIGDVDATNIGTIIPVEFYAYIPGLGPVDLAPNQTQPLRLLVDAAPFRGLSMAARLLKPGTKATFVIPPSLAYGDEGNEITPPGATILLTMLRLKSDAELNRKSMENPYLDYPIKKSREIKLSNQHSYLMGYLRADAPFFPKLAIDSAAFLRGISDYDTGKATPLDPAAVESAFAGESEWNDRIRLELARKNEVESRALLNEIAAKKDIKSTSSGLLYRVIKEGNGRIPKKEDVVQITCEARLTANHPVIDLWGIQQPLRAALGDGLLPGLREGLLLMPVGSEFELYLPPSLGFGTDGASEVPPGSTLFLTVKLFSLVEP